jgi:hypothetical protein
MLGGSRATLSQRAGAAWRLLTASLAALFVLVVLILSGAAGEAQACPPEASIAASISHKLAPKSVFKAKAVIASQTMMAAPKSSSVRGIGACCGGSHGFGCPQSGCACCAVAVFEPAPGVFIEKTVSDYVLARRVDVTSASPDPNYRPPCPA